jgi:hypothetical protein
MVATISESGRQSDCWLSTAVLPGIAGSTAGRGWRFSRASPAPIDARDARLVG